MSVRDSAAGSPVSNVQQVRGPILIEGDANFTAANGVTSGTGLPGDPYIIAGWNISAAASNAISIRFTTASFEIRDTRVHSGGASYDGIVLEQVSDARINNVTADSNDDGIHVTRSNGVTVAASTFEANRGSGLTVLNTLSPRVENDSVTGGSRGGIYLDSVADATVANNRVSAASYGLWISGSPRATISWNEAIGNGVGVYLGPTTSGLFTDNTLVGNSDTGLTVNLAGPVDVAWNNVSSNGQYGFYLNHWTGGMHHNRFFPGQKGFDSDANNWDDGYPNGGNWWDGYAGVDRCHGPGQDLCPGPDGFGDTPVSMDGGGVGRDRYPRILPSLPPTAQFISMPADPLEREPVSFDGSVSYDPDGFLVTFLWDFGDGGSGSGIASRHAYSAPGSYRVTLDVMDNSSRWNRTTQDLTVGRVEFVPYESAAGFRVPIPKGWDRRENVPRGNATVELELLGPIRGNVQTNILVDSDRDATVRENRAYLETLMNDIIRSVQQHDPSVVRTGEVLYRTIAGHASVTFVIAYGTTSLVQKIAVVVSEAHGRYWAFILTVFAEYYETANVTVEGMLGGFEITLAPPASLGPGSQNAFVLVAVLGGGLAGIAALVVFLAVRRKPNLRWPPPPVPSLVPVQPPLGAGTTPGALPVRFCPYCGTPTTSPSGAFCGACGKPLSMHPGET